MNHSFDKLSIDHIIESIPHRYPFLLIDRVLDYKEHDFLTAVKNVTINEPFFQGHFPGRPIMPGVLMLESLAQACAVLSAFSGEMQPGKQQFLFAGIDNARFKRVVTPGDQLLLQVKITGRKRHIWKMSAEATVDGQLACSADLLSATQDIQRRD